MNYGLQDFVPAGYPLPYNPITLADFVPGGFPLPFNPVFFPSAGGSLPKSPNLPMAAIGAKNGKAAIAAAASAGCGGCGCGGSCGGCGGMGDIAVPSWAMSLPSPLDSASNWPVLGVVPNVYVALGVAALIFFIGAPFVGRSARRRR